MNDAITKFTKSVKNQTGGAITPISAPTSGLLKLNSSGNANTIGAIDVTVAFPAGVTVKVDTAAGAVAPGVITISGAAAVGDNKLVLAKFVPAVAGTPARLRIGLINGTWFGVGEFVTIKFDLDEGGSFPASKDEFSVTGFDATGVRGLPLSGVTAAPVSVYAEIK
jgi:hypothetical protein